MPKYRQLHTKIIDSFDFNDIPDDFTRVVWLLLTIILDSEGRGIDNMAWVRSKMFPLRTDVTTDQLENSFTWLADKKMIIRYQVDCKKYFYIPTFKTYQSGTSKEAPSNLPCPPELVKSSSGANPPQCNADADADAMDDEKLFEGNELSVAFEKASKILAHSPQKWTKAMDAMVKQGITPEDIKTAVEELQDKGYNIVGIWSIQNAAISCMAKRKSGKKQKADIGPSGKPRGHKI